MNDEDWEKYLEKKICVDFDDCCIRGSFVATVKEVAWDGEYLDYVRFDNGVFLSSAWAAMVQECE